MDLATALDLFINQYSNAATRRSYTNDLDPFITALGPGNDVRHITDAMLIAQVNKLHSRSLAPATIYKKIKAIKAFFNFLERIGELDRNPTRTIRNRRPSPAIERDKAATPQEIELLKRAAFGHVRNYALVCFLADSGCRAGGVATLTRDRLHTDYAILYADVREKPDKIYRVWFSSSTAHILNLWLIERPLTDHDFVFCGVREPWEPLTSDAVSQIIYRLSQKARLRALGSHSLRHAKGFALADQGTAASVAATILNHVDPSVTLTHYYPRDLKRAEEASRQTHVADETIVKVTPLRRKTSEP